MTSHPEDPEFEKSMEEEAERARRGLVEKLRQEQADEAREELAREPKIGRNEQVQKPETPEELYAFLRSLGTIQGGDGHVYEASQVIETIEKYLSGDLGSITITRGNRDPRVGFNIRELAESFKEQKPT